MIIILTTLLYTIHILTHHCTCLNLIDLPQNPDTYRLKPKVENRAPKMPKQYPPVKIHKKSGRRYWLVNEPIVNKHQDEIRLKSSNSYEDEKDTNLKYKIATLVGQTMHAAERQMRNVEQIKESYRDQGPYRAGFVLSLVKKSRDVLNELFNVAIKHRDEWKALEQLKIFELIMHTNVDTTNLLRQLVDIHLNYLNSTYNTDSDKRRVILL